jgi:hypothetical protein
VYRDWVTALKRSAFKLALFFTVVLAAAYVSLFFFVRSARFQQWLKAEALHRTGHEINLSDLRLKFPFTLAASRVTVSKESETLLQGDHVTVALSLADLFSRSIYRIDVQKPVFRIELQQLFDSTTGSFDVAIRRLNVEDGTIVLKTPGGKTLDFRAVNLQARNVNLGQSTGIALQTEIPWLKGSAEIAIRSGNDEQEAEIKIRQAQVSDADHPLPRKSALHETLNATIKLQKRNDHAWVMSASGKIDRLAIAAAKMSGQFDSRADIDPGFKSATFSASIRASELPTQIAAVKLAVIPGGITGTVEGNYQFSEQRMILNALHLESAYGRADGEAVLLFSAEPTVAKAQTNLRSISAEAIHPFLPEWTKAWRLRGTADVDLKLEGPWSAIAVQGVARTNGTEVKSETFSLQQLNLIAPFEWANSSLRASDVRIQGKKIALSSPAAQFAADELQFQGALASKPGEPWRTTGKLRLVRGRYAAADGSTMGENFVLGGQLDATIENRGIALSGTLNIEEGEFLWGKFFGDLKSRKPALDFDGDYFADQDELQLRQLDISLAAVGKVGLKGTIQQISLEPKTRLQVMGSGIRPAGAFEFFIRETMHRSYPILDQLIVGGRVDLTAQVSGTLDDLFVDGNLQIRRGSLGAKSNRWQIGPLNLALPFSFHLPAAEDKTSKTVPNGTLAVESLRLGSESVPSFKTPVSLSNNTLIFKQPLRVPIYGGSIEIRDLAWNDLLKDPQAFALSIEAQDFQLQRLTESLGWYRFGGTISASIPRVEITGNVLRAEGQIEIEVFGGAVQVSNTAVENPFSALPAIKLDARFQGIHLEQASKTFAFGRISGILDGTVTDLVIINGQPAQLRADVRTVERPGASQWISVEALNQITILSSGEDGSLVYGGIASFFDEFRYSKMGFKATLRNDKLTLRGIESRDGKEFLVVGTLLPPTVNVISHTREIGFSDLMKRLEQIQKTDKPEIK